MAKTIATASRRGRRVNRKPFSEPNPVTGTNVRHQMGTQPLLGTAGGPLAPGPLGSKCSTLNGSTRGGQLSCRSRGVQPASQAAHTTEPTFALAGGTEAAGLAWFSYPDRGAAARVTFQAEPCIFNTCLFISKNHFQYPLWLLTNLWYWSENKGNWSLVIDTTRVSTCDLLFWSFLSH